MRSRILQSMGIGLLCSVAMTATSIAFAASLSDIGKDADKTAIEYLKEKNIIKGYADGTFKPNDTVNRAELLKMLIGSLGLTPSLGDYHDCFLDVHKEWFAPYICYAKEKKLISGYSDNTFRPNHSVNTVEAIKMAVNMYGYQLMQTSSVAPYSDVDPSAWYAPYVHLAMNAGILETGKKLGVSSAITRGKVSGIIYRSLKNRESGSTHPAADITKKILPSLRRGGGGTPQTAPENHATTSSQITLSSPTISLGALSKNYGDAAFTLIPTSNSAGTFSYDSSNTGVATVAGNTVTILAVGTTTITVTQAANGDYSAGSTTAILTINAIAPTIGTFTNVTKQIGDIPFTLTAPTSNSAGTFTYMSGNTGIATISDTTVTLVSPGITTITATQAANGNFTSGVKIMTTFRVVTGQCELEEPCLYGGTCTNQPHGTFSCTCIDGHSGPMCDLDASNCDPDGPNFCLNGGICTPTSAHGECSCAPCFGGARCDEYQCA